MYGFNQIPKTDFLVDSELIQVCIGNNEVILNFFPDGNSITVFDVKGFLNRNRFLFESLLEPSGRIRQIGKVVVKFIVQSNDTATLIMSDGAEIVLKDDSVEFEAATFSVGGRVIVV